MSRINKLRILLKQQNKLFHTRDLALLWKIDNLNTLHTTISRYIKNGTLVQIYKGFYSVLPLNQLDPIELGSSALHTFNYLSLETVLFQAGIINQPPRAYTFCASVSKTFSLDQHHYKSRQLADQYLYHPAGIFDKKNYRIATTARAVADLLYYNPKYYLDGANQLNWKEIKTIQKEVYQQ